ncbi:MAG: hypothetical protein NZ951_08100 [Dehalococcoidia bacterium]|nr:hypothetical protein [Dehalococcoidia bacterium]MDW8119751.1 hypothetical protein [Chloroflexota bacterium]
MPALAGDYFIFVFLSSLGVVQVAAAYAGLWGILFLRSRWSSALVGVGLVALGFAWFFAPGPRHIPDTHGGLDGNAQALLFTLAAASAVAFTLLFGSLVNARFLHPRNTLSEGLDALREATYLQALWRSLGTWWKGSWPWMRNWSSGSTGG